jgi:hypothetical protein
MKNENIVLVLNKRKKEDNNELSILTQKQEIEELLSSLSSDEFK